MTKVFLTTIAALLIGLSAQAQVGGYEIRIEGSNAHQYSVEAYVLKSGGSATYMHITPDNNGGAKIDFQRYGTWSKTGSTITIKIKGRSGYITEKFTYSRGSYRSGKRYLKKVS